MSTGYQALEAFDETFTDAAAVWRDLLPAVKKLTSRKRRTRDHKRGSSNKTQFRGNTNLITVLKHYSKM